MKTRYSQIYGAVTMNNTMNLGVFYALIYVRGLTWTFSAETLSIFFAIFVICGKSCFSFVHQDRNWFIQNHVPTLLGYHHFRRLSPFSTSRLSFRKSSRMDISSFGTLSSLCEVRLNRCNVLSSILGIDFQLCFQAREGRNSYPYLFE